MKVIIVTYLFNNDAETKQWDRFVGELSINPLEIVGCDHQWIGIDETASMCSYIFDEMESIKYRFIENSRQFKNL